MEVGLAKGLAQSMQYDQRMQDERWYEEQMQRAKDRNLAELNAFEKDLEYMNAANSYDHGLIKGEADKTIKEIGALVGQNPDWRYNPEIRRQINEKKKYLKSNEHVLRGMASDDAFNRLNKDLAEVTKNPAIHNTPAYQNLLKQKQNYLQYGHQEGLEGLKRDGGPKSFVYTKPADFIDLPSAAIEIGNKYKSDKYVGDGRGGHMQVIDESTLRPLAQSLYNQRKEQIQIQHGIKNDEEGIKVAENMIRAGIKLERKFAEPNHALIAAQWKHRMDMEAARGGGNGTIDTYNKMIRDAETSYPGAENLTKMIGVKPTVKIYDADNNHIKDESGREFIPAGSYMQVGSVKKVKPYKTKDGRISEYAKVDNDNLGVIHGYSVYSKKEMDELGWDKDASMKKNIEVRYDNGKDKDPVYLVKSQHVFNPRSNQAYAFKLNNAVGETSKQIQGMGAVENIPTREIERHTDGTIWDAQTKQYLGRY